MLQARAVAKGIFLNATDGIGNDNLGKGGAAVEGPSFYRGHAAGNDNAAQVAAIRECHVANRGHRIGQEYHSEVLVVAECLFPDFPGLTGPANHIRRFRLAFVLLHGPCQFLAVRREEDRLPVIHFK